MKRYNLELGPKPDHIQRLEDLARDILRDIGCLENTSYEAVQSKHFDGTMDSAVPYGMMVPAIKLEFDYPEDTKKPAFLVHVVDWATGSLAHDEVIKYRIRQRVEIYLKSISRAPGRNSPADMRLDEWDYT